MEKARQNSHEERGASVSWEVRPKLLDEKAPPMADLVEMFAHMVEKALDMGFKNVLDHFNTTTLRVATMCSGTDSPITALQLIQAELAKKGSHFAFEHLFSAEIEPFKQAFIQRNFSPPTIFRDVEEMALPGAQEAPTAFGCPHKIPRGVHLLIAGFSCVDFSRLNAHGKELDGSKPASIPLKEFQPITRKDRVKHMKEGTWWPGESGTTFFAILDYAELHRPVLVILENVDGAKWGHIQKFWDAIGYATKPVKLNTRDYYIPCTRLRTYMLCIDTKAHGMSSPLANSFKPSTALSEWISALRKFRRPASSPVDDFLFGPDDPDLRTAVLSVSPDACPSTAAWVKTQERHRKIRRAFRLGDQNPLSQRNKQRPNLPASFMQEWLSSQPDRVKDMLDILHLYYLGNDMDVLSKSFIADVSQNVDRKLPLTHPGIAGCITPSGLHFSMRAGRLLTGRECLILQGLDRSQISLTTESLREVQDLAGNAMTTTVVGSAILAALLVAYRMMTGGQPNEFTFARENKTTPYARSASNLKSYEIEENYVGFYSQAFFVALQKLAKQTARLCLCEDHYGEGDPQKVVCMECGNTACRKCGGNPVHRFRDFREVDTAIGAASFREFVQFSFPAAFKITLTPDPFKYLALLFKERPNVDYMYQADELALLEAITAAQGDSHLTLSGTIRSTWWTVRWTSGNLRLDLVLEPSAVRWEIFLVVSVNASIDSRIRALVAEPIARMKPQAALLRGMWEICLPNSWFQTIIIRHSSNSSRTLRAVHGLELYKGEVMPKYLRLQLANGICIQGIGKPQIEAIAGTWKLLRDCGTPLGCLYVKCDSPARLFLFRDVHPLTERPHEDCFVVSRDCAPIDLRGRRDIICRIRCLLKDVPTRCSSNWRPNSLGRKERAMIEIPSLSRLLSVTSGQIIKPTKARMSVELLDLEHVSTGTLPTTLSEDCCQGTILACQCQIKWQCTLPSGCRPGTVYHFDESKAKMVLNEQPSIISKITLALNPPLNLRLATNVIHKIPCTLCCPERPSIQWMPKIGKRTSRGVSAKQWVPREDPSACVGYGRDINNRPAPFRIEFCAENDEATIRFYINMTALAHRATSRLHCFSQLAHPSVRCNIDLHFKDRSTPARARTFVLRDNADEIGTKQLMDYGASFGLRADQQNSFCWMIGIETGRNSIFAQQSIAECFVDGPGWMLRAWATQLHRIPGGLLADEIGYGKTLLCIALIKAQMSNAANFVAIRSGPEPGRIRLKATLIVVPGTLILQWEEEIKRFWPGCNTLCLPGIFSLRKTTIKQFREADTVITSHGLLENDVYFDRCARLAAFPPWQRHTGPRAHADWLRGLQPGLETTLSDIRHLPKLDVSTFKAKLAARMRLAFPQGANRPSEPALAKRFKGRRYVYHRRRLTMNRPHALWSIEDTKPTADLLSTDLEGFDDIKSWEDMKFPSLFFFDFFRKVVDEFHYIKGRRLISLRHVSANFNWFVSGTPNLTSFADANALAELIGCPLNRHKSLEQHVPRMAQGQAGSKKKKQLPQFRNHDLDLTAMEKFEQRLERPSNDLMEMELDYAQRFLDTCARRNHVSQMLQLPLVEHVIPVLLDWQHEAVYHEIEARVCGPVANTASPQRLVSVPNDRLNQLHQLENRSRKDVSPVRMLCHFATICPFTGQDLGQIRNSQAVNVKLHIFKEIRLAQEHAAKSFRAQLAKNLKFIEASLDDGQLCQDPLLTKDVRSMWKSSSTMPEAFQEILGSPLKNVLLTGVAFAGWDRTDRIHALISHARSIYRASRYIWRTFHSSRFGLDCDRCQNSDRRSSTDTYTATSHHQVYVLADCGHSICDECFSLRKMVAQQQESGGDEELPEFPRSCEFLSDEARVKVKGNAAAVNGSTGARPAKMCGHDCCTGILHENQLVDMRAWNAGLVRPSPTHSWGSKVLQIAETIKRIRSKKESSFDKILVFSMYDDLSHALSKALDHDGITYRLCLQVSEQTSSENATISVIEEFKRQQQNAIHEDLDGGNEIVVLILPLNSSVAAGHNLQIANHVIFATPFLPSDEQTDTHAQYDQAIGRCRRFGQRKPVHVYYCAALRTAEVSMWEHQLRKRLVFRHSNHISRANEGWCFEAIDDRDYSLRYRQFWGSLRAHDACKLFLHSPSRGLG